MDDHHFDYITRLKNGKYWYHMEENITYSWIKTSNKDAIIHRWMKCEHINKPNILDEKFQCR
jgi:uncharacterized protein YkwD